MSEMSEWATYNWAFVGAAFGLTWAVLASYAVYLQARARQARLACDQAEQTMEVER
jgi:hypothetical protein